MVIFHSYVSLPEGNPSSPPRIYLNHPQLPQRCDPARPERMVRMVQKGPASRRLSEESMGIISIQKTYYVYL
jgi:hypothetical protein